MKQLKKDLDIDFIGGADPLTKEEEKKISAFIKSLKERRKKQTVRKKRLIANKTR